MNFKFCITILFFIPIILFAQSNKFTISGSIKDEKSGEAIIGCNIKIEGTKFNVISNSYGFYSITLNAGVYNLLINSVGFQSKSIQVNLNQNKFIDILLISANTELKSVEVSSVKKNIIDRTTMGLGKLDIKSLNKVPVVFGEKDILKTLQLLPGIKSTGEANSGISVRGGTEDQNFILLDEAPVYNPNHFGGLFSTFNSDALKDVQVYKGYAPAKYGGRLSSVFDIKMKEGNNQRFEGNGGIGLITSRFSIEGPIQKGKSSFIISARRSYADIFLLLSKDTNVRNNSFYFYDLNAKANFYISKKDRIFISGYFGQDNIGFGNTFSINWGNQTFTTRFNHIFNSRLFSNTSIIFSSFLNQITIKSNTDKFKLNSKINDINLKQDFDYFINANSKLNFGFNIIKHATTPGSIEAEGGSNIQTKIIPDKNSIESALYFEHEFKISNTLNINYGFRLSDLSVIGPGNFYSYNAAGIIIDTLISTDNQVVKSYLNIEPRFALNFKLNDQNSIKIAYSKQVQNLHLLTNSNSVNPTDTWVASSTNIKPEITNEFALGYYLNSKNNAFEFSIETYYKDLQNQIDYKPGAQLRVNDNVESELIFGGVGRAYGIEFLYRKKTGKLNGWIGYTLSRTEKKFEEINNNQYYPIRQDRTHEISIVAIYEINQQWSFSSTFQYYTGNAVSFPSGKYLINNLPQSYYGDRNQNRYPNYNRLDISFTYQPINRKNKKMKSSWNFSVYNVLFAENPIFISFVTGNNNLPSEAKNTYLFPIPAITWNFKF